MTPILGQILLLLYALIIGAGGVTGYVKAASRPSLIAGTVTAMVAFLGFLLTFSDYQSAGFLLGALVAAQMSVFFAIRYAKTRDFIPKGLLSLISFVVLALLILLLMS